MSTQETKLRAIADAIREKEGSTGPVPANDFASRIRALPPGMPDDMYTVTVEPGNPEAVTVSGGGTASAGMVVTVKADIGELYTFKGWQENGLPVSFDKEYTFQVARDRLLSALADRAPSRLPAGYTEVAYLETDTGTGGFQISTAPRTDSVIEAVFELKEAPPSSSTRYLLYYAPDSSHAMRLYSSGSKLRARCSSNQSDEISMDNVTGVDYPREINYRADLSASPKTLVCNGQSVGCTWTLTAQYTVYVLARSATSNTAPPGSRIKRLKMSSAYYPEGNANYAKYNCELVPCVTPEGVAALYDLANSKVYTPSFGSVIPGPPV